MRNRRLLPVPAARIIDFFGGIAVSKLGLGKNTACGQRDQPFVRRYGRQLRPREYLLNGSIPVRIGAWIDNVVAYHVQWTILHTFKECRAIGKFDGIELAGTFGGVL